MDSMATETLVSCSPVPDTRSFARQTIEIAPSSVRFRKIQTQALFMVIIIRILKLAIAIMHRGVVFDKAL